MTSISDTTISYDQFQKKVLECSRPVLVEFWADWCGACHILAPIVKDLSQTFEGQINVCRVDADTDERIGKTYGIRDLPALLFFKNGHLVDHVIGTAPRTIIAGKVQALLDPDEKE